MKICTFKLNNQPMSEFVVGAHRIPAFSGLDPHINKRISACISGQGPIPPKEYFIVDRESGGRLGWLYDLFNERSDWFALYANDGNVDDSTWCKQVQRGQFRLHPKGVTGRSEGCIVINQTSDFHQLKMILKSSPAIPISGSHLLAWGKVLVK